MDFYSRYEQVRNDFYTFQDLIIVRAFIRPLNQKTWVLTIITVIIISFLILSVYVG